MKIYFTCSTAEFNKYKKNYFAIRDFLVSEDHILTRDWLGRAKNRIDEGKMEIANIKEIYKDCIDSLIEADLVIIEDTVSNFSTGHQITLALQRQKPTLVLWCRPKHRHFHQTFIQGIESEYLEVKEYNIKNYKEIIRTFIKKYENAKQRNRFNLVISDMERKYLDWRQFNTHKSRTSIIRESIRKSMSDDAAYKKYLSSD